MKRNAWKKRRDGRKEGKEEKKGRHRKTKGLRKCEGGWKGVSE